MPILRNQRYDEFEHSTPRDSFRGMPLQRFPWLLAEKSSSTLSGRLQWKVSVYCLNASPSGFGSKLNMELRATAVLRADSAHSHAFQDSSSERVGMLFGDASLTIEDELNKTVEGRLEDLAVFAYALLKEMLAHLNKEWPAERIQSNLRENLRRSSPGGFASTRWS
ncbi:MAG: hypothetical protein RL189_3297 [Pseudomonadota bacterium]|jgi:hypothetical protein